MDGSEASNLYLSLHCAFGKQYLPARQGGSSEILCRVQANGDVSIREMSERIQQTCTVHKADVQAVLLALEDVITDALKGGEIVRLGDLGTLQISISSKGAVTEEEYDASLIKKARINFRPGVALAGILTGLTYKKVAKKPVKTGSGETEEEEGGEDLTA